MTLSINHINRYYELGFIIHPLCPPDHHCKSPGKIPYDPIEGKHMPGWSDHEQFHMDHWREWIDYDSSINVGMLTGCASRIVGIDVDDEPGDELVRELWSGETWEYTTGKGRRLLFRHEEPLKKGRVTDDKGRSFEVLGDGANNVIPPSEHASGSSYAWTPGLTPKAVEIAPLPSWARAASAGGVSSGDISSEDTDWVRVCMTQLTSGRRNDTMTQIAGRLLGPAPLNTKEAHMIAQLINRNYGQPPMAEPEVTAIIKSIGIAESKSEASRMKKIREIMWQHKCDEPTARAIYVNSQ